MAEEKKYETEEERWQALRIEGKEAEAPEGFEPDESELDGFEEVEL